MKQAQVKQTHGAGRAFCRVLVLAGAWLACGCAHFRPLSLPGGAGRDLSPETVAEIRMRAADIRHPILRPLAIDLTDGLSPDEAGVFAVLANPSLRAVRDARQLAAAQSLQAGLLPNPRISAGYGTPIAGDSPGDVNPYGFGVDWDVTSLIARSSKLESAGERQASVDLDIAWQEWQVAQSAKMTVWRIVALEKQVALARDAAGVLAEQRQILEHAVDRGSSTGPALAAAKAASRQIRRSRLELEKQLAARRLELNRLLGLAPSAELVVATPNLPTRFEPPSKSSLSREIERRRPDLLALRRGYQSQQAAVRAAILGQFPKIDIGVVHDRDSDNIKTAGFQVGIDLPVFDRNQGRIAAERATRQKLRDEYADRVFRARSDVAMLCGGIGFLNRQIAELRDANADFQNLADTYARALKAGRADAMAAFDARIRLAENRRNEIASRGQLAEAICALELASGIYQLR